MRLVATCAFLFSLLGSGEAFVPRSLKYTHRRVTSELRDIPSSLKVDIPLPAWFVENGNGILSKLGNFNLPDSALSNFPIESEQLVTSLLTSLSGSLGADQLEILKLALTPWHLETILAFGLGSSLLWFVTTPETFDDAPYEPGTETYDPIKANAFYEKRPLMVIKRILKLALLTGSFNTGLLFDWLVLGKLFNDEEYTTLKKNEPRRAKAALGLCEELGPTFIKL